MWETNLNDLRKCDPIFNGNWPTTPYSGSVPKPEPKPIMSITPRTDKFEKQEHVAVDRLWSGHARTLELELAAKDAEIARLRGALRWIADGQFNILHPLTCDFQEDARYTYPERLTAIMLKAEEALTPTTPQ